MFTTALFADILPNNSPWRWIVGARKGPVSAAKTTQYVHVDVVLVVKRKELGKNKTG